MLPTMRQSFNDMFKEADGKLSLIKFMTYTWFLFMIYTIVRILGRHHEMSEPIITAILTFEALVFLNLLANAFLNKTKLNFKNLKDGVEIDNTNIVLPTNPEKK